VPVGVCQSYYIRTCRTDGERHGGIREGESLRADYKGKGWLYSPFLSIICLLLLLLLQLRSTVSLDSRVRSELASGVGRAILVRRAAEIADITSARIR